MKTTSIIFMLSFQVIMGFCQNLILNSDFENNHQLYCDSWYDLCGQELTYICETNPPEPVCDVFFYQDAPPADGTWSIGVTGVGNSGPSSASAFVTGLDGTGNYQLNVWMKDVGNAWGGIEVGILSEGQFSSAKTILADSGDWKFYTTSFVLKIDPLDSIEIRLWAFAAGPSFGVINFDLVELIRLDTLNSILHHDKVEIRTFPNPCNDYFMIELNDQPIGHYIITVFNSVGYPVRTVHTDQNFVRIDVINNEKGLFFYQVKRALDQKIIGFGKIIAGKE